MATENWLTGSPVFAAIFPLPFFQLPFLPWIITSLAVTCDAVLTERSKADQRDQRRLPRGVQEIRRRAESDRLWCKFSDVVVVEKLATVPTAGFQYYILLWLHTYMNIWMCLFSVTSKMCYCVRSVRRLAFNWILQKYVPKVLKCNKQ